MTSSSSSSKQNIRSDLKVSLMAISITKSFTTLGGSPGLVVMGGDSCSEGRGFESQHHILDGHVSHLFVVKNVMFV